MRRQIIDKFGTRSSDGTSYLSPKKIFSSIKTTTNSATSILNLRTGQVPNLPRGLSHIRDNNQSTTTVFDPNRDKISNSQEELFIHEMTTRRLLQYSTYKETRALFSKKELQRPIDYHGTRTIFPFPKEGTTPLQNDKQVDYYGTQNQRQPMTMLHEKASSRSAVNSKESTIHQNVKSTAVDTHPHESQVNITINCSSL